jgi:hypothetical protein
VSTSWDSATSGRDFIGPCLPQVLSSQTAYSKDAFTIKAVVRTQCSMGCAVAARPAGLMCSKVSATTEDAYTAT